jgi:glycosyltransferase involved in cell wall biosynthesis
MSKLAAGGRRVLYVDSLGLRVPRLSFGADRRKIVRRLRKLLAGLRQAEPNLWVMAPHALPGHHIDWIRDLNRRLLKAQILSAMKKLSMRNPHLWIFLPTGVPLVGELGEKRVIYYAMDEYLANPGVDIAALKKLEDRLVSEADAVLVTAPRLLDKFRPRARHAAWVPCGVDVSSYLNSADAPEPLDLKSIPHPRIGFAGNLTGYKADYDLLDRLIRSRPQWNFLFMGTMGVGDPDNKIPAFMSYPNVHWLGEKPYKAIPSYLQQWDAGIIPYRHSATTDAIFPFKLFEYLAAGLPVVSTPLPSLGPYEKYCALASDADSFAKALEQAISRRTTGASDRKAVAAENSWDARIATINQLVAGLPPRN